MKRPVGKWLVLGFFAVGAALFFYFDLGRFVTLTSLQENKGTLRAYAASHSAATVIVYILLYALQTALLLPGATIFTLAGGFLFGAGWGTVYVNIAATSGATLAFLAARYLLRERIERRFGKQLSPIQQGFDRDAFSFLLTLRLIPLFPFFLVNMAAGLTRIRLTTYLLATSIGILPGSFVYSYAGQQLDQIQSVKDIASPEVLGAFLLFGILALLPVAYKKFGGRNDSSR
jgi:uncharacterized membrane protein YdjX (TVP38/TMEM64 family)